MRGIGAGKKRAKRRRRLSRRHRLVSLKKRDQLRRKFR
jgi:hypothetical protein